MLWHSTDAASAYNYMQEMIPAEFKRIQMWHELVAAMIITEQITKYAFGCLE